MSQPYTSSLDCPKMTDQDPTCWPLIVWYNALNSVYYCEAVLWIQECREMFVNNRSRYLSWCSHGYFCLQLSSSPLCVFTASQGSSMVWLLMTMLHSQAQYVSRHLILVYQQSLSYCLLNSLLDPCRCCGFLPHCLDSLRSWSPSSMSRRSKKDTFLVPSHPSLKHHRYLLDQDEYLHLHSTRCEVQI